MQRLEINCTTNKARYVDLTSDEEKAELAERASRQNKQEVAEAQEAVAVTDFATQLARFAGVDPADEKAMAALQKRLAGV